MYISLLMEKTIQNLNTLRRDIYSQRRRVDDLYA